MNTLYSPFVRFSEIALEFMRSKDDPEKFQNFKNSWLAEPWEDTATHTSEDLVLERQTDVPEFIVPDWARMLTGGVDVQKDCMYYTIRAWGDYLTSQNIVHGQVRGWADIERVMNQTYRNEDGDTFVVMLCLVDSGYNTDETYEFCLANAEWATPVKGSPTQMETYYRISTVNKAGRASEGIQIVIASSDKYKDMIASRMHKPNGTGSWMVYSGCDSRYAAMVTAEHKINVRSNGKTIQRWVPKASHIDNHYLDCEVYAMAAADIMGVRSWYGQEDQAADEKPEKQGEPEETEENWIQKNEGWI